MDLQERVRRFADEHAMFSPGGTVVVAVSGGPDSIALLHILHVLRDTWPLLLVAAHLDHGFRGAESAADAEYVREICGWLAIPCRTAFESVPELKKRLHLSSQEAARHARHAFLRAVAAETGAARIAIGHTRDDRAETILLNIFRGAGLDGLAGFPPVRAPLVRPLYDVTRAETQLYCAANALSPRTDASNATLDYARNRLRNELLPYAARYFNPKVAEALLRLADLASADAEALESLAAEALDAAALPPAGAGPRLCASALASQLPALQRRALRLAIAQARGSLHGIEHGAIDSVLRAVERQESFALDLPGGEGPPMRVQLSNNVLSIVARGADSAEDRTQQSPWSVALALEGRVTAPHCTIETRVFGSVAEARAAWAEMPRTDLDGARTESALLLPLAGLRLPLTARSWQAGDRMRPRGMNGVKKLQDIFVDRNIPRERRLAAPVVVQAGSPSPPVQGTAGGHRGDDSAIVGVLGVQGSESSVSLTPESPRPRNIGACVLIMALSHTAAA